MASSYSAVEFVVGELGERYKCIVCHQVLFPAQSSCGHRFCWRCLDNIFKKDPTNPKCLDNKEPLERRFIFGDKCAQKEILALEFPTFIFLDLETTGLIKPVEITELSMIAVERAHIINGSKTKTVPRLLDKLTTCVRPTKEIETQASMVTCISNEDLEKKKEFDIELGGTIRSFIMRQQQPACLVAHNGDNFDFKILVSHLDAVGITLPETVYATDSRKAFTKQHEEAKNESFNEVITGQTGSGKPERLSLKILYNSFVGGEFENAHSAEEDALALLKLVVHKPDVLEYLEKGARELCCHGS